MAKLTGRSIRIPSDDHGEAEKQSVFLELHLANGELITRVVAKYFSTGHALL